METLKLLFNNFNKKSYMEKYKDNKLLPHIYWKDKEVSPVLCGKSELFLGRI